MGKKQHSKDRMFLTKTEWATSGAAQNPKKIAPLSNASPSIAAHMPHSPFLHLFISLLNSCLFTCNIFFWGVSLFSLTFTPFELPVCTKDGSVFDIMNIIPYIRKYGKNPVTGAPLKQEDLIPLTFHKNSEGEYHCPVLNKVFTEYTHIVAVKTTGNAIKELNIKTKNWKELLTDEPFAKEDIITIQMLAELGTEKARQTALLGGGGSKAQNERAAALTTVLAASSRIKEDSKSDTKGENKTQPAFSIVDAASASVHGRSATAAKAASSDKTAVRIAMHMAGERAPVNAKLVKSRFTTGAASRSFTSTSYDPVTKNEFEYVKVEKNPKKKGCIQLHTTHGDLNIELHCDITPRTCENLVTLCERGYYNGVAFHRNIRNFMIQGGDPTGTGRGGESIWGKPFKVELNSKLLHSGRGVVSMANSGTHTNGSQFFILYKSANHLNFKHTVFGGVVGGLATLSAMEKVPVDDDDRPLEEIKIISVTVFVNPYMEPDEEEVEEKGKGEKAAEDEDNDKVGSWYSNPGTGTAESGAVGGGGVGKYLKARNIQIESASVDTNLTTISITKKSKEEIKIISVTVFVNPYMEPDEEEVEEKGKGEKTAEDEDNDKVGSWYSNPGTGTAESGAVGGGGVGKYLKARNIQIESASVDTNLTTISITKKSKVMEGEFKDFSAW
ncbi:hypothetical protein CRYUN_Cryun17cG0111700 [Craigia yunnanensis]